VDWPYLSSALLLALSPSSWALYTVIGRRVATGADPFDTTYAILVLGSLPILALARPAAARALAASPEAQAGLVSYSPRPPGRPS
jgi:drug/metabolite transporter (DMT)-like permease